MAQKQAQTENSSMQDVAAAGQLAPLTIFYAGNMKVYENVPPNKAKAIMFLLSNKKEDLRTHYERKLPTSPLKPSCSTIYGTNKLQNQPQKRSRTELPFARKASLARFLEKRKIRVEARQWDFGFHNDHPSFAMDGNVPTIPKVNK